MTRLAGLFAVLLCSALMLAADGGDKGKGTEMTGFICNSKCVSQSADKASCDLNCKDKGGDAVFVDDQGKVTKIANQKKVKSHQGQKVKMVADMDKNNADMMYVYDVLRNDY